MKTQEEFHAGDKVHWKRFAAVTWTVDEVLEDSLWISVEWVAIPVLDGPRVTEQINGRRERHVVGKDECRRL
jgi:hypothetical protein